MKVFLPVLDTILLTVSITFYIVVVGMLTIVNNLKFLSPLTIIEQNEDYIIKSYDDFTPFP